MPIWISWERAGLVYVCPLAGCAMVLKRLCRATRQNYEARLSCLRVSRLSCLRVSRLSCLRVSRLNCLRVSFALHRCSAGSLILGKWYWVGMWKL